MAKPPSATATAPAADTPVAETPAATAPAAETPAAETPAATAPAAETPAAETSAADSVDTDLIDDLFKDLKALISSVEKLQKARQDVGDVKPLISRLLDGELLSGTDLEDLRGGIGSLSKLLKLYGDYQTALERAQPARALLDQLLEP